MAGNGHIWSKHREGEEITVIRKKARAEEAVAQLLKLESHPVKSDGVDTKHMAPGLANRMSQTIRARRKRRHFNAEQQHTRKNRLIWSFWSGAAVGVITAARQYLIGHDLPQLLEDAERKGKVRDEDDIAEGRSAKPAGNRQNKPHPEMGFIQFIASHHNRIQNLLEQPAGETCSVTPWISISTRRSGAGHSIRAARCLILSHLFCQ